MLNEIILTFLRLFIQVTTICGVGKIGAIYGCGWQVLAAAIAALIIDSVVYQIEQIAVAEEKEEREDN